MPVSQLMRDPAIWLIVLVLSFGVISEMAVGGWLVNFLEKAYHWNTSSASGMLSAFFVCFTFARLLLGPVTDKIGFTLSLILFSGFPDCAPWPPSGPASPERSCSPPPGSGSPRSTRP
ncbi:hypothetical protein HMSSN036_69930 [Paenibacillus macerans]|nr:hypothetical protein HMSSN036_69930 [Paenibacillus macerans]